MDDLLGEDWQKPAQKTTTTAPSNPSAFALNYSSFRASPQPPLSGNTSPLNLSRPSSTVNGAKAASTDNFSNLLSLKSQKGAGSVSIQERQKQLLEEKRKQQEQQSALWDSLGSGRGTPEIRQPSPAIVNQEDDDDILAAFNKDAPVNKASHFAPPPPSEVPSGAPSGAPSGRSTPVIVQPVRSAVSTFDEDDDPFGLNQIQKRSNGRPTPPVVSTNDDDDNILGDLARPVFERKPVSAAQPTFVEDATATTHNDPEDRNLAELVDMGFPPETAKIALMETGGNVQDAVGWLIQQAHEESRQKVKSQTSSQRQMSPSESRSPQRRQRGDDQAMPTWMRQEGRPGSASRPQDGVDGEKDAAQVAQEIGTKFLKGANSLWKAGQKQMAKRMAEFQQDGQGDPSQPKWMREAAVDESEQSQDVPAPRRQRGTPDVTNEAAALDAPRERPQKPARSSAPKPQSSELSSRTRAPVEPLPRRPTPQPKFMQQAQQQPDRRPASKLSRQDIEEQTAQAYVSPARRKRPTPKSEPPPEPEVDLFSSAPPVKASPKATSAPSKSTPSQSALRSSPAPPKPKAPPRTIPSVSPSALSRSASHRKAGGDHFKRGDYGAAHESYTAALTPLPPTHPIAIIVLSNRSLTALKTGDPKVAISDADKALEIVGPSLGAGETIDLGAGEGTKDMKEFYGKALMRKAEALEHMEKYSDAAAVWRLAVEAGVGGAVSLRGRDRCEKAAAPRPAVAQKPKPVRSSAPAAGKAPPAKGLGNSLQRPAISTVSSQEAVKKLRAANAEAEKADDEKFALADTVDAKLTAWRGGKTDNLRALLQSMDIVLWESAGWKKVGMSDLVLPPKVKIVYMKAIAKVHPDKVRRYRKQQACHDRELMNMHRYPKMQLRSNA